MARIPLIIANWKMHAPPQGWEREEGPYRSPPGVDVVVLPTLLDIRACREESLIVGAQCARPEPQGAFTGDVSMENIASHGCTYVLCGHSERRRYHGETDAFVAHQARSARDAGLTPIVCVGEKEEERKRGAMKDVVERQIREIPLPAVFAYEPLWAIGTGNAATPKQAQEMHAFVRSLLRDSQCETTRILYGGSVTPANARSFLEEPDIDGLLVGGASLDPTAFREIVEIARECA